MKKRCCKNEVNTSFEFDSCHRAIGTRLFVQSVSPLEWKLGNIEMFPARDFFSQLLFFFLFVLRLGARWKTNRNYAVARECEQEETLLDYNIHTYCTFSPLPTIQAFTSIKFSPLKNGGKIKPGRYREKFNFNPRDSFFPSHIAATRFLGKWSYKNS